MLVFLRLLPSSPVATARRRVATRAAGAVAGTDTTGMDVEGRLHAVGNSYGRVIRSPSYFPLWLAQLLSSFGDTLHYIALVVLVFQLTGQGAAFAALVAAEIAPVLILGPIAGVVIDRFSRKSVLISADLFR